MGWFDMNAAFGDPGYEHKEDLQSGLAAAAAGGFTGLALLPNTKPVTQTKNAVSYLTMGNRSNLTQIHPIAAVTIDTKGEELTEMIDLHEAGAIAFSDGTEPLWHSDILMKTLQYLQKFNGLLITRPEDVHLSKFGVMNEGAESTILGMKGIPNLAEEIIVQRDLELLNYAGGRLHFSNISSTKSLDLIKKAKKTGLEVTCDIASFQVSFDDTALGSFDTNLKIKPPFRTKDNNSGLIKGLKDGVIDVITSSHQPQDVESKKLEFDLAELGVTSLQTVGHNLVELSEKVDWELLIDKITKAPRELLGIDQPKIEEGEIAELTLLDPHVEWEYNAQTNLSKSENSPYWNDKLKGRVVAVFGNGKEYLL